MKFKNVFSLSHILIAVIAFAILLGCGLTESSLKNTDKKVLVIGFDGMDPKLLERLVQEGKMPNFERLMKAGDFKPLKTSIPPQSPVAWSNFITGMNPGGHGIFDFIHRETKTMIPYLSTSKTEHAKKTITIGDWVIPLSSGKVTLLRHGKAFWEVLEDNGVPTTIFRAPANFPPIDVPVVQLSGMGTPDIQGTYGTFSFYTDGDTGEFEDVSGGKVFPVRVMNDKIEAKIFGPQNVFRKSKPQTFIDFSVFIDTENPVAKITVQDHQIILKEGEWSDWADLDFELIPFLESVSGICRFYLKEVRPDFKLYVTPVNIDPSSPAMRISTPVNYSEELYEEIGYFYTQGIPEDTKALTEKVFDDSEFLQQAKIVFNEELHMFDHELSRFKKGVLFFYFGRVDQVSHMFWRTMDLDHPAHEPATKHRMVIESVYQEADAVLKKALNKLDSNTTIIVLSDHGFAPFYRSFNLNTWLKNEGYVSLADDSEGGFLQNVEWSQTRAYGMGFNGLYLNLKGREGKGIVQPGVEKNALMVEISTKLLAIRDLETGKQVISRVYRAEDIYKGPYVKEAPDLIIGYNKGFRASTETVLGKFPKELLKNNMDKWSGDHLIEDKFVPGILLSNKKIQTANPALYDIAPTILAEFGIPKQEWMVGMQIFNN
jgi:predicted AlkP superfamily phosphohydrolase/phosphomutase